jgi:hypothetical protein
MCSKVWEELTISTFSKQPRYGVKAGQPNPRSSTPACSRIWC